MFGKTVPQEMHDKLISAKEAEIAQLQEQLQTAKAANTGITQEQLDAAKAEIPEATQQEIAGYKARIEELEGETDPDATKVAGKGGGAEGGGTAEAVDMLTEDEKEIQKMVNRVAPN